MLQGSLDNFALDEVLGLLSSTGKTGHLELDGDRGTGSLTLREGGLVDAHAAGALHCDGPEDVLFELLRYSTGSFTFRSVDVPGDAGVRDVAEVMDAAETRLADFRTIEAVVPSLAHHLHPAENLPADEVTIGRREWAALRAIGPGGPVSAVCDALELNEIEGSRQVKSLVERGLLEIGEPRSTPFATASLSPPSPSTASVTEATAPPSATPGPSQPPGPASATAPHQAAPDRASPEPGHDWHGDAHDDWDDDVHDDGAGQPRFSLEAPNVFTEPRPGERGPFAVGGDGEGTGAAGPVSTSTRVGLLPPVDRLSRPGVGAPPGVGGDEPVEDHRVLDDGPRFDTRPGDAAISPPPVRRIEDGDDGGHDEDRPGGLLMRYLKNEG